MKKVVLFILLYTLTLLQKQVNAQSDTSMCSLIKGRFAREPFEGGRIVKMNGKNYVISLAIVINSSNNTSMLRRIGTTKARRNLLVFLEGSEISSSKSLITTEVVIGNQQNLSEVFKEEIKETALGIVDGTEELCNWYSNDSKEFIEVIFKEIKNRK